MAVACAVWRCVPSPIRSFWDEIFDPAQFNVPVARAEEVAKPSARTRARLQGGIN